MAVTVVAAITMFFNTAELNLYFPFAEMLRESASESVISSYASLLLY